MAYFATRLFCINTRASCDRHSVRGCPLLRGNIRSTKLLFCSTPSHSLIVFHHSSRIDPGEWQVTLGRRTFEQRSRQEAIVCSFERSRRIVLHRQSRTKDFVHGVSDNLFPMQKEGRGICLVAYSDGEACDGLGFCLVVAINQQLSVAC